MNPCPLSAVLYQDDLDLYQAIKEKDEGAALRAIEEGADANGGPPIRNELTHLIHASGKGMCNVVTCLLEHGADANKQLNRCSPLATAASQGHAEVAELLIRGGAELETRHVGGATALHFAAFSGRLDAAKCLVAFGASMDAEDWDDGDTPLDIANRFNHDEVIQFLTAAEAADAAGNLHGLFKLCGSRSTPLFDKMPAGLDVRYEFLLCLLEMKKTRREGSAVEPCASPGITLVSRLYDHEQGIMRLVLSFVGPNQEGVE
jgi:hypothetical protein